MWRMCDKRSSLLDHPNVVRLRATYEDGENVHLVMELCEGGELFDRIVVRRHYTERAASSVDRTVMKPKNFLFADKKENSTLKAIDFGLFEFFNLVMEQGVALASKKQCDQLDQSMKEICLNWNHASLQRHKFTPMV